MKPDLKDYIFLTLHQEEVNETLKEKEALTGVIDRLKTEETTTDNQLKNIAQETEELEKSFIEEKAELDKHIQELEEERKRLMLKPESIKRIPWVKLRSKPIENLFWNEAEKMLKERDFFSIGKWRRPKNKQGNGLNHQYEVVEREGEKLVIDHTTDLTWQQSGSADTMVYAGALQWIEELNKEKFAGYGYWRLPTLEEAMSLMEPEQKNGNLYISEVFDKKQEWILTSDKKSGSGVWVVFFNYGLCNLYPVDNSTFVRAVRWGQ